MDNLSYHVYDPFYDSVLTIVICDMQFEDVDSHMLMWKILIKIVKEHVVLDVNFKKFMVDSTQINFHAARILFGGRDLKIPMENLKCIYLCHWAQSLLLT